MLVAAIAHYFVFSHKPFVDPAAAQVPCVTSCLRMLDIRDVYGDVKEHFVDPIPRPKIPRFRVGKRSRVAEVEENEEEEEVVEVEERQAQSERSPLLNRNELQPVMDGSFSQLSYRELRGSFNNRSGRSSRSSVSRHSDTDDSRVNQSASPLNRDASDTTAASVNDTTAASVNDTTAASESASGVGAVLSQGGENLV